MLAGVPTAPLQSPANAPSGPITRARSCVVDHITNPLITSAVNIASTGTNNACPILLKRSKTGEGVRSPVPSGADCLAGTEPTLITYTRCAKCVLLVCRLVAPGLDCECAGGRWTMDDGRWTMDDGRWTMDDGRWTMDDGRWTMDDGRWTMDDGRWTMDDGQQHLRFTIVHRPSSIVHRPSYGHACKLTSSKKKSVLIVELV